MTAKSDKNILFIMFDQLRYDYLSCYGHPFLKTPHIDSIARKGVRFTNAYVQSPVCGASRMSYYTGRYVNSHGAAYNNFPLKVGEQTIGDHLRKIGVDTWLIGKTHMKVDSEGLKRLGIKQDSIIGARLAECGFDIFVRDDGLWAEGPEGFYCELDSPYNEYLKSKGYSGSNPWSTHANAGITDNDDIASGWFMKNSRLPANIREEDSETPWLTTQMIHFLESEIAKKLSDRRPWMVHLSYIKPHWPYIVPAPYNDMYNKNHIIPVVRSESEIGQGSNPIYKSFTDNIIGRAFRQNKVREEVIPAYMGLIKQCDDQMGRLFKFMEDNGFMENTLIVICSDHGDYLGDHWLGEKDLFHEPSVKTPLIIFDPSKSSNNTRGTINNELVEAIDLAATFIDYQNKDVPDHILEGRSLMPFLLNKAKGDWRKYVVSEYEYSTTGIPEKLNITTKDARLFMVFDGRYKLIHAEGGIPPMLFDLKKDPQELKDLGPDKDINPEISLQIERLYKYLAEWARRPSQRNTLSDKDIEDMRGKGPSKGITLGLFDGTEINPKLHEKYRGKATRFT